MPGRTRQRIRPTREQTRLRLLDAAGDVFARRGYDGASLDDVAAAAGLTKGAVYSSFGSKEKLFYALMAARLGDRLKIVADASGEHRSFAELFGDAEADLAALMSSQLDWQLLFIEFWARSVRDPDRRPALTLQRRGARSAIADFFERQAAAAGVVLPATADELAVAAMALSNGLAIEHLADPEQADPALFSKLLALLLGAAHPTTEELS